MKAHANLVRQAIEHTLATRVTAPFGLAVRAVERTSFGIAAVDALLDGGAPRGAITELVGIPCSGRTTAALHLLSRFSAEGSVCAWVDVADVFSPSSAAANGIDLQRLLWVRCGRSELSTGAALREMYPEISARSVAHSSPQTAGGNSPHPRMEGGNMPQAIQSMLGAHGGLLEHQIRRERKVVGIVGAPNRPLMTRAVDREEQIPTDRMPPRRDAQAAITTRCAEPQGRRPTGRSLGKGLRAGKAETSQIGEGASRPGAPWKALDQALRATDLLLTNGGFAAIVLDLGSTPSEFAWRVPLATWFRYRAACERNRCSLVLLTQYPCARSSAGLVMRLQPATMEADGAVVTGVRFQAEVERSRFVEQQTRVVPIRKPPQSERAGCWKSEAV
jgi:recombination protein RecA